MSAARADLELTEKDFTNAKKEEENLAELEKDLAKKYSTLTVSKKTNEHLRKSISQVHR